MKQFVPLLAAILLAGCTSSGATVTGTYQYPAAEMAGVTRFVLAQKQPDGSWLDVGSVPKPALSIVVTGVSVGAHTYAAFAEFVPTTGPALRSLPSNEVTFTVRPGAPTNLQISFFLDPDGTIAIRSLEWRTGTGRNARS